MFGSESGLRYLAIGLIRLCVAVIRPDIVRREVAVFSEMPLSREEWMRFGEWHKRLLLPRRLASLAHGENATEVVRALPPKLVTPPSGLGIFVRSEPGVSPGAVVVRACSPSDPSGSAVQFRPDHHIHIIPAVRRKTTVPASGRTPGERVDRGANSVVLSSAPARQGNRP